MAMLRGQRPEWVWPAGLGVFDSARWSCREEWHLARAHAAPNTAIALQEIRASLGVDSGGGVDEGGVVIVQPPGVVAQRVAQRSPFSG
jgi:hypothetical protein